MNKWLFTLLSNVISMASPQIIDDLRKMIDEMMTKAKGTVNPWDDIFVGFLQMLIGKPGDKDLPKNDFR